MTECKTGDRVRFDGHEWLVAHVRDKHSILLNLVSPTWNKPIGGPFWGKDYQDWYGFKLEPNKKYFFVPYDTKLEKIPDKDDQPESTPIEKVSQEKTTMADKATFMERFKPEATEAAYRVAGAQMTKAAKGAILRVLQDKGVGNDSIGALAELFNTEFGEALVACILGFGLEHVPMLASDPRLQKIAKEFRVSGMATAGNAVMGVAMEYLLPAVTGALNSLPTEDADIFALAGAKMRVDAPPAPAPEVVEEEEEEEEVAEKLQATA